MLDALRKIPDARSRGGSAGACPERSRWVRIFFKWRLAPRGGRAAEKVGHDVGAVAPARMWGIVRPTIRRILLLAALSALVSIELHALRAAPAEPPEYAVKAAFVFNFVKYVDWPAGAFADSESPIVIGVLGDNPFGPTLDRMLQGKAVNGRRIVTRRLARADESKSVHLLFICRSEKERLGQIVNTLNASSVLSVADIEQGVERGTAISFAVEHGRVGFSVNLEAAERAGLHVSSKLLRVAQSVRRSSAQR
jgi:uncharacterized protein DUF4154